MSSSAEELISAVTILDAGTPAVAGEDADVATDGATDAEQGAVATGAVAATGDAAVAIAVVARPSSVTEDLIKAASIKESKPSATKSKPKLLAERRGYI